MSEERLLIIFAKNPEKGRVKTRLAESLGDEKALEVYHKLLDHTLMVAEHCECDRELWFSRYIPEQNSRGTSGFTFKLQRGEDLGERMSQSFQEAFENDYQKAVIIGSDCAELTSEIVEQAYKKLEDHNLVLGPSVDGGYYLLGMKRYHEELFEGISWSTEKVFQQTLESVKELNLDIGFLPELNDVDIEADWRSAKDSFSES
ncbi:glycosyltransferase [Balneolaceae bacterium YR4-1]|uniref:Glycosyltransferase n=1 Tax=Halalkalibaculum roseum TaxID=2709311 RepID=A0A6M1T222_9BACT|nr:TIGR04282 family arsenosugar biosynthesis glycosyltransferase [Halalkalibaculum roseum]NGP77574.1 glycosyltransferase [Halalkalibaculum roseum]